MIVEMVTVGPFQENCYVIGDESSGTGALIDPGDEAARIALTVERIGLSINQIIVTHSHIDHVGAIAPLTDEFLCPVLMHEEAEAILRTVPQQAMMMGIKFGKVPKVDRRVTDDEVLEVGNLRLRSSTHRATRRGISPSTPKSRRPSSPATRSSRGASAGRTCRAGAWMYSCAASPSGS